MLFGMVSGDGRGMGVLDRGGYLQRGRGTFGSEFGTFHVTTGDVLHCCAEAREPIELSFGVVSGLSQGLGVHVP